MRPTYQDALAHYGLSGAHPGGFDLTKALLRREPLRPGMRILDAGCGTGQTSAYLAKNSPCKVTAIDHHPIMISKAKNRFAKEGLDIEVVQGSIEELPFNDHSFDFILVESVTLFTNRDKSFSEFYRVLKPKGILLDSEMTAEVELSPREKGLIQRVYQIRDVLTEKDWLNSIMKAGFSSSKVITSNTVMNEMLKGGNQPEMYNPSSHHPQYQNIIMEHQQLLAMFADKLGYRVFRAQR